MKMKLVKNRKYLQQTFLLKVFVHGTATDFTFRVSKIRVPFTCQFSMTMYFVLILHKCCIPKTKFSVFITTKLAL